MKLEYITEQQLSEMYDEALDSEGTVVVAGLEYYPSNILEAVDPIAYFVGRDDYASSLASDGYIVENYNEVDYGLLSASINITECGKCGDWFDCEDEANKCCGG
tara:strand:+ start:952 stop:1263 length:312 start_codon:yes stop_codon:yes gene_type:complete